MSRQEPEIWYASDENGKVLWGYGELPQSREELAELDAQGLVRREGDGRAG
jgi:hypothetical protein